MSRSRKQFATGLQFTSRSRKSFATGTFAYRKRDVPHDARWHSELWYSNNPEDYYLKVDNRGTRWRYPNDSNSTMDRILDSKWLMHMRNQTEHPVYGPINRPDYRYGGVRDLYMVGGGRYQPHISAGYRSRGRSRRRGKKKMWEWRKNKRTGKWYKFYFNKRTRRRY